MSRRAHMLAALLGVCLSGGAWAAGQTVGGASLDRLPQVWRDDDGRDRRMEDFRGHPVVLTMAYANCHRICPATMDQLRRLQSVADARGEGITVLVVGYDPANDTPAIWHEYRVNRRLTRPNWHFFSGSPDAVRQLAQLLGFPFWTMEDHVMHESRAVVFDADGTQRTALGPDTSRWADAL